MKIILSTGAVLLLIALAAAFVLPARYVFEHETITQVLWNHKEAYLFSGVRRIGWSGNYAELAWQVVQGLLGKSPKYSANHAWLVVVKIDANGVDQHIEENTEFFTPQPFEESIYRGLDPRSKWSGRGFTKISEEERTRFLARVVPSEPNYTDIAGWSSRMGLLNDPERRVVVPVGLEGVRAVVVAERGAGEVRTRRITIQLEGKEAIQVLSIDESPRIVGATEFVALMSRR